MRLVSLFFLTTLATALHGALPPGDDADGAVRGLVAPSPRPAPFAGKFDPAPGDTIVFLGGTEVCDEQFTGYFETLATLGWADRKLTFQNMAWQADTVYRQQRPQYFYDDKHSDPQPGSTPDQRQRVEADIILVRFGKMESFDGIEALPKYREAYGKLLDQLMKITPRVVVVSGTPFYPSGPAASLARKRNDVLAAYNQVNRQLAGERQLFFADTLDFVDARPDHSDNGIHPNEAGQRRMAESLFHLLIGHEKPVEFPEALRQTVIEKNRVWVQYFRPTNWAFLYGDRQHVPSSRDHTDGEKRWFPYELERALPLIEQLEGQIHAQAQ